MDKYTSMQGEYVQFVCQDEIVEGWADTGRINEGILEIKLAEFTGGNNDTKNKELDN